MTNKSTFLFCTLDGMGHLNCALALARLLAKRGHRIVFFTKGYKTLLIESLGYENVIIIDKDETLEDLPFNQLITRLISQFKQTRIEGLSAWRKGATAFHLVNKHKVHEKLVLMAVDQVKPDIVVTDYILPLPGLFKLKVPWISLHSANPLPFFHEYGPPRSSGYSVNSDPKLWEEFKKQEAICKKDFRQAMSDWFAEWGLESNEPHSKCWIPPLLGLYVYPESLDYVECGPRERNWFRIDPILRLPDEGDFQMPENLKKRSGKLIFLSLGTLGSCDFELLQRLIGILGQSEHRFIVSKGPMASKFQLAENMWGDAYVNQLQILPLVDLVITHGGNQTFTECLYFGKPMIVMPLFADQHDNAQRAEDKQVGRRFDPYTVEKDELLQAIDDLLGDDKLRRRLESIRKSILRTNTHAEAVILIEKILQDKKCPFKI